MDKLFPLATTDPLFTAVPLGLTAAFWLLWWLPVVCLARRDAGKTWAPGLLWGVLGPIGLLNAGKPLPGAQLPEKFPHFHGPAWLVGSLVVVAPAGLIAFGGPTWLGLSGEYLHTPISVSLALSGLLAGLVTSWIGRRVGFFENLGIVWSFCASLLAAGQRLDSLFTFGTTAVFLLVMALTSILILFLALLLGASLGFLATGDGALALSFSYEAWVGRRYLLAKRRQSFISVITFISIAGVTVGVWAMLVVLSVMSGFEADLKGKILGANAHMIVQKAGGDFFEWEESLKKVRENEHVLGASPFVFNEVMISSDSNLSGAIIKGVDVTSLNQVSDINTNVVQGTFKGLAEPAGIPDENTPVQDEDEKKPATSPAGKPVTSPPTEREVSDKPTPPRKKTGGALPAFGISAPAVAAGGVLPGIVIGQELARNLRVFIGDRITVVSPVAELGPTGPVPRARTFRIAAIFYSGMYEYDSKFVYIALKEAMSFFSTNGGVTGIEVRVDDVEATTRIGRSLVQQLGGFPFRTRDWKDMNRNLFAALKLEKIAMFIILAFIILVASFNILSTLIMVVLEKGKEIAILKSMGSTDASIMKIFVTYGLTIGFFGTTLGVAMGYVSCRAIETFGIGLDPEVYYIANLPVKMNPVEFVLVALAAMVISQLATVYPALQASRLKPVEGLRYE